MREWWANVYIGAYGAFSGYRHEDRSMANSHVHGVRNSVVHVRLKPEGAPRRYASEEQRRRWDSDPKTMREVSEKLDAYWQEARARWAPSRINIASADGRHA